MKCEWLQRLAVSGAVSAAALLVLSRPAQACGGFFCSVAQPVNQAAERIIFADNGDGTITAVIQILYQGPSKNFSWLLPISTVPQGDDLAVASDLAFTRLQAATNPQYNLTTRVEGECGGSTLLSQNSSPGGATATPQVAFDTPEGRVTVEASGVVGQFAWTVISLTNPNEPEPAAPALAWLRQNGYDVPPEGGALIGPYLADGMYLLALKLVKGSDSGSIRPIALTYSAQAPMIPIKLTAVAANQDMGVMTWALSNARAVPLNYNALELNEARINWFNASSNYNQVVTEAADAAGGQGFVTEFAGPSTQLADVVWLPGDEAEWSSVRSGTYGSFSDLLQTLQNNYEDWSGFWDAVRRVVTLPAGVSFEDFKSCPYCYSDGIEFSPTQLFAGIESDVIEPLRGVQRLIDRSPYTTRLYSTLSAAEMTVDPVFVFNPDLPEVNNVHRAERVIECNRNVDQFNAPWRIELPQGSLIRGTAATLNRWPSAVDEQPANFRVLTLSSSGAGRVVDDNADEINTQLVVYNQSLSSPSSGGSAERGGFCSLGRASDQPRAPLALTVPGLLGAAWLRRRRRARSGGAA
jgi:hypothetical protein